MWPDAEGPAAGAVGELEWDRIALLVKRIRHVVTDFITLQDPASAGLHFVDTLEIGEVVLGQAVRRMIALRGHYVHDAGQLLARIQRVELGERQHGNIIGQGHDLLSCQLGGIDDDQDMVEAAVDAIVDAATARLREMRTIQR